MSIGRRRPKLSRAQLRPSESGVIKEDGLPDSVPELPKLPWLWSSMLVAAAIVHGSGPPFTYRLGERPGPRASGQGQGIPDPQPDQDEQRAPGRGRPGSAVDGQRPRADPGAGRETRRPDDRRGEIGSTGRLARKSPLGLEAEARELPRPEGRHRHSRAPRQPACSDHRRIRAACFATAYSGPGTLPPNEESSRVLSIRKVGEPVTAARLVPRDRVVPERIVKPEGPVVSGILRGLHLAAGRPDPLSA